MGVEEGRPFNGDYELLKSVREGKRTSTGEIGTQSTSNRPARYEVKKRMSASSDRGGGEMM